MIHIVTDSTAQLTKQEINDNHITVIPLQVTDKGKTYDDDTEMTRAEFSKILQTDTEFPITSQPPIGRFIKTYQQIMKDDPDGSIISIHISDVLSGTTNTASSAAKQVKGNIKVINSGSADRGTSFLVLKAAEMANSAISDTLIIDRINKMIPRVHLHLFINNMDYLVKGGRASKATGFISSLMRLKPIFQLSDNKFSIEYKCHGKKQMAKKRDLIIDQLVNDESVKFVGLPYVDSDEEVKSIAEKIHNSRPDIKINMNLTSPSIMVHAGPNGYAIIYY